MLTGTAPAMLGGVPAQTYHPKPVDIEKVILKPELEDLVERLAQNAHELWAEQRLKDGWVWGEKRDDTAKKHPCLIAYNALPESEKEYDRVITRGLLKTILAFGYSIEPGAV